ncbi:hypothetical protein D3C80_1931860 [compost metagenome]
MAIKGYGNEPLDKLLERSLVLTDSLEGNQDAPMARIAGNKTLKHHPEPHGIDPFLDYVESQGWLKGVEDRFV